MAKQSFVTGQVLTAQQVNDLQTNDFNQTVSAKTASYTLVAADKGTRITMSSTSATTITVNTGLFAAGDTLFIQNLNTGVCSITAGTATVDTSASLALAQHEGGTLYFTSAGVSTFFKAAGAAASSGGMTVITSGSLSTTSVSISGFSGYNSLLLEINNPVVDVSSQMAFRFNNNSGGVYSQAGMSPLTNTILNGGPTSTARAGFATYNLSTTADNTSVFISVNDYDSTVYKNINMGTANGSDAIFGNVRFNDTTAITSIQITTSGGTSNFTGGTYVLYGVK